MSIYWALVMLGIASWILLSRQKDAGTKQALIICGPMMIFALAMVVEFQYHLIPRPESVIVIVLASLANVWGWGNLINHLKRRVPPRMAARAERRKA